METMVTRDGGYSLPSQINIHEWKQWLQGWGVPLRSQSNIHKWKQWLQGMGGTPYCHKLIFINGNKGYKGWGVPPTVTN